MAHQLKIYKDKAMQETLKRLEFPRTEIGKTAEITVYMHNSSEKWPIMEIKHNNESNKDLSVQGIPQQLRAKETVQIKIKWTPSIDTDDPLSTILDIDGELHVG
jgi:hypothetical protein